MTPSVPFASLSNQYVMPISPYNAIALVRCP
jgi:hypothetical protein